MNRLRKKDALDKRPSAPSISALLIWAVNLPLTLALAVLLPLDYRREVEDAITAKQVSLEEEAETNYLGILWLTRNGRREELQRYINTIWASKQKSHSPDRQIAVRLEGELLLSVSQHRLSSETIQAMQQAAVSPDRRAVVGDKTLVVGSFGGNGVEVYISEYTSNIRRAIQSEIYLHLAWLAALAIVAAGIVNVVLQRIVTIPVRQLSSTVTRIAQGEYELQAKHYRSSEMSTLSITIRQMSESLVAHQRERHSQMDRARRIQEHLLPNGVQVPRLAVAHLFQPADEVAGDYYDLIQLHDGTWLICVGDVTGHGVSAAMGSAMLKALLLHATERYVEPIEILQFINQRLPSLLPDEFITMFLGRWHAEEYRLEFASAGHEPGLLFSQNGELRKLSATGYPLGIDLGATWEIESLTLSFGQRILLTTDGAADASSPSGAMFGRERLAKLATNCINSSPQDMVDAVHDAINKHRQGRRPTDDLTILLLESTAHDPCLSGEFIDSPASVSSLQPE